MGFLPFVNQDGRRVVRWGRLALACAAVFLANVLGCSLAAVALSGGWRDGAGVGTVLGVFFAVTFTVQGLSLPVGRLPPACPPS